MKLNVRTIFLLSILCLAIHLLGIAAHHAGYFLATYWPYKIFLWGSSIPPLFGFLWVGIQAFKRLK